MESLHFSATSDSITPTESGATRSRRLRLEIINSSKFDNVTQVLSPTGSTNGGTLTPDVARPRPSFVVDSPLETPLNVGNYILEQPIEIHDCPVKCFKAFHPASKQDYICKIIEPADYQNTLRAYLRSGYHENVNFLHEVVQAPSRSYFFFEPHYGDLHMYVRHKKRLREPEAAKLFLQMVAAIDHCHDNGIALRDMKLRRWVFKDPERTELKLFGLEEAHVFDCEDDREVGLQVCPAYMSPEVVKHCNEPKYSTRKSDLWTLGVMLYTMLIGKYPFSDPDPGEIFKKVQKMDFTIPDTISSRAKCLVRHLMRFKPDERLSPKEIPEHPWYNNRSRIHHTYATKTEAKQSDQVVPKWTQKTSDLDFFA